MTSTVTPGTAHTRIEGPAKVTGNAVYAYEQDTVAPLHLCGVGATIARGRVRAVDTAAAAAVPGVVAVLTADTAPRLDDGASTEQAVLQTRAVHHRGQYVAAVLAETAEAAREAAGAVVVTYDAEDAVTAFDPASSQAYTPEVVVAFPPDTRTGDPETAFAQAPVRIDATYRTPIEYHHPMEPHSTVARWDGRHLTLFEASQSVWDARRQVAALFGIGDDDVTVVSPHVGGGFGTKGALHAGSVLAVLAARAVPGRSVKLSLTRREMTDTTGYRPATVQRVRLGAGTDGRLHSLGHDVVEGGARMAEFGEPTAVISRHLYAAPHRRTSHRVVPLDLSTPTYMRAPGEAPAASVRSPRSTSSPSRSGSTRSSCGSATSPTSTPTPAGPSPAATSWPACGGAPTGSAGRTATRGRAPGSSTAGGTAPVSPPRSSRRSRCPAPPPRSGTPSTTPPAAGRRAATGWTSPRPTSARAPARCSPRSRPRRSGCRPRRWT